ncbi:MAG: Gluconolactonase [Chitinophagaceae bacterium]|nr:Gluconolactonase [Chitinophagaceae bacterium]
MQASLLYQSENILAEGPYWHVARQSFFWVDIDGKCFHEYQWPQGKTKRWELDYRASFISESHDNDKLILALQGAIASFDLQTGKLDRLLELEKEITNNRTNDGGCDSQGRLWIGTMDRQCSPGKGSLYCIDSHFHLQKKLSNISVSNGIVWSPDGKKMYYTDSPTQQVQSFLFDEQTGNMEFEKIAITVDRQSGSPDGMCMDEEGMLWIAQWGGFGVYRWNPLTGKMLDKIEVPAPQVSSCAFGGENMDQLFITTARENMSEEEIHKFPLSGNVFIAQPGVKGIPVHKFGKRK